MARRPHIPDADQPEFSFGLELPSNETVNEGPVASLSAPPVSNVPVAEPASAPAPEKINRKQRRAAAKQKAAAPVETPAPQVKPAPEAKAAAVPAAAPTPEISTPAVEAAKVRPAAPAPAKPAAKVTIRPMDAKQPTPFETLLHNELGRVFNFCLRLTQDAALADDLAQDVFVNAAKDLPEATSAAPAPHRLTRDVIDLFCRNRRYNRPRKALVEPVETPAPAQRVERAEPVYNLPAAWDGLPEDHRALLAALGTLDAEDRVILVLKDVEGRSYAGAGEILELGESSMRSRVSSARERLHAAVRKLAEQKKP